MVPPPEWLSQFVNAVSQHIYAHGVLSPLGCHFHVHSGVWEVTLFASRTEIVGGPEDGRSRESSFNLDVARVAQLFERVDSVEWQAQSLGPNDELGPHLAFLGSHSSQDIWLRITEAAPERFEAGRRALVNQREFEEIW